MSSHKFSLKLQGKFAVSCILLVLVLSIVISWIGYYNYLNGIMFESKNHVLATTHGVAKSIQVDKIEKYIDDGEFDPYLTYLQEQMTSIRLYGNVAFHYMFRIDPAAPEGDITYVLMGYNPEELKLPFEQRPKRNGTETYPKELYESILPLWRGEVDELVLVNRNAWGYMISAFVPIKNAQGETVSILSTDFLMDYINATVTKYFLTVSAGALIALVVLLLIYIGVIKKTIIGPIHILQNSAKNIVSSGHQSLSNAKTDIRTGDEIEDLSHSFNYMIVELEEYIDNLSKITAEKERIGAELDVATKIQSSMLPCLFPAFPEREEFDIYATMLPAKEVGGDFYDFFLVDDTHLGVVVADVSGKGVPAALFMVIAKTLIKNYAQLKLPPSEVFTRANQQLCEGNDAEMFVTAFMGILDIETGDFTFANAGHNPPAIKHADGSFEWLKAPAKFVLAGMEGTVYKDHTIHMQPDDVLYLYTDGVTEATNAQNELYSEPRLMEELNKGYHGDVFELLKNIKTSIDSFVAEAPQFDDITMLALKMNRRGQQNDE